MPHLSPVIWNALYALTWMTFLMLMVSFEYNNSSLKSSNCLP